MNNDLPDSASPEELLQALVLDRDLERLEDLLAEFNLFDVLKIERRELQHSALLAWLLDPRGSHGLRDYFLRRFLSEATAQARERGVADVTPLDVDGWKLDDIEVATERHNIDVLLIDEADRFVCLIENKIGAGEHSGQLSRYLAEVEGRYEGFAPFPIFLTPDGAEPNSEHDAERYVPLDYGRVAALVDRTLRTRGSTISSSVAAFLRQYARTLRRHVLNTTDNIDELALQIYNNHRAAIDIINGAMPALENRNWEVIDGVVEQHAPLFRPDGHSKGYRRFYAPDLEEIPDLKGGRGWTRSRRILLFEFQYTRNRLVLNIGPGPDETRRRIYELCQRNEVPGVEMRLSRNLGSYHTVYSRPLPGTGGLPQPDYKKARPHIEQALKEFVRERLLAPGKRHPLRVRTPSRVRSEPRVRRTVP